MATPYEELFQLIDADQGGTLSLEEVQQFVEKLGLPTAPSPQVIARLFVQADADRSNAIDKDEFTALCEGIKWVVRLTEKQMVDAYAAHEIKRLFTYLCTNNGNTMRKDELRKAVDVLNHALELDHPDTTLNSILRDITEVDFDGFRNLLSKLCPEKSLTSVANVFVMEERRRREHLLKVKSMYEMGKRGGRSSRGRLDTPDSEPAQDFKCGSCPLKDQHIETLSQQIASLFEEKRTLETRVRDIGDVALREVQFNHTIKKLQNQVAEEAEKTHAQTQLNTALKATIGELNAKIFEFETLVQEQLAVAEDRDRLMNDFNLLEKEQVTTRQEVSTLQERLARKTQELAESQNIVDRLRVKLQERDDRIADLERRESEVHVKEIESLRMQRLMAEMRERVEKRESELDEIERQCAAERFKVIEREKELEGREDMVTSLERAARRQELECQERWDSVFRKAQTDLDIQTEKLNIRELEITNKEGEMTVREQIFEANQRKAEATSLPERERRLKLLQSVEQQLSIREKNIRMPERSYVQTMLQPELITLREENHQLKNQVVKLRVDVDAQQQRLKEEVERSKMERLNWIEKSKLGIELASSQPSGTLGGSFAAARSRRQSIIGSPPSSARN